MTKIEDTTINKELEEFNFEKIDSFEIKDLINKPSEEIIDLATKIAENTKNSLSSYSEQQVRFYNDCSQLILGEQKNISLKYVSSFYCSNNLTYLKNLVEALIAEEQNNTTINLTPLIIVSDNFAFFKELENENKIIYVLENWNKKLCSNDKVKNYEDSKSLCNNSQCSLYDECKIGKQLKEQEKYPILIMSKNKFRSFLNIYKDEKIIDKYINVSLFTRNKIIIDGSIDLININKISINDINRFKIKIESSTKIQNFNQKHEMYNFLDNIEKNYIEAVSNFLEYKTLYVSLKETSVDFEKFKKEYLTYFGFKDFSKIEDLETLFNDYSMWSREDNGNYFFIQKSYSLIIPDTNIFILDKNSHEELKYKIADECVNVTVSNYEEFKNLTLHFVDENLSKSAIKEKEETEIFKILDWINKNINEKTYLISYKEVTGSKFVNELNKTLKDNPYIVKNENNEIFHFGSNEYNEELSECKNLIYLGWKRYSSNDYLAKILHVNEEVKEKYKSMHNKNQFTKMEKTLEFNHGIFKKLPEAQELLNNHLLEELENEIWKIKTKKFDNDNINIYIFITNKNFKKFIRNKFKSRYKNCKFKDVKILSEGLIEESGNKVLKKIFDHLETWDGKKLREAELLKNLNIEESGKTRWRRFCDSTEGKELLKQKNINRKKEKSSRYFLIKSF